MAKLDVVDECFNMVACDLRHSLSDVSSGSRPRLLQPRLSDVQPQLRTDAGIRHARPLARAAAIQYGQVQAGSRSSSVISAEKAGFGGHPVAHCQRDVVKVGVAFG